MALASCDPSHIRACLAVRRSVLTFEVHGGFVIDGRVTAMRIVPPLDVVEDYHTGDRVDVEAAAIDELALEGCEEAFTHGVIIAVTGRAHRGPYTGFPTATPEGYRRVLASLVGVMNNLLRTPLRCAGALPETIGSRTPRQSN